MHDGGLPSSELAEFVPGANFYTLQIISILIIRGELNNYFLHLLLQLPYKFIYMYWNCFFSYLPYPSLAIPLLTMTVTQGRTSGGLFLQKLRANLTNHKI